jgi:transporter family protein
MAALTKVGLKKVDPIVGLAIQTVVVLSIAWGTLAASGRWRELAQLDQRGWSCLLAAGIVTAVSYLFLFHAVKLGNVSQVVPLDRLSLLFAIILGATFLGEKLSGAVIVGGLLMAAGAGLIAMAR